MSHVFNISTVQFQDIADQMAGLESVDALFAARKHPTLENGEGGRAVAVGPIEVFSDAWDQGTPRESLGWIVRGDFSWEFTQTEPKGVGA